MKYRYLAFLALLCLALANCAGYTKMAPELCQLIQTEQQNQEIVLKHSMYYGPMYDDERYLLLSEWPFANTSLLSASNGTPMTPGPANDLDIIPIGTKLRIVRIEFPDKDNFSKRLLFTPRFHPWVILEPVEDDPFLPKKPLVVTLPIEVSSKEQVEQALTYHFGNEKEVSDYLNSLSEPQRIAITHKIVIKGMNFEQVTRSLGKPLQVDDVIKGEQRTRTLTYGNITLQLINDTVINDKPQKNSRPGFHNPTL